MGILPASQYGSVAVLPSQVASYGPTLVLAVRDGEGSPLQNPASSKQVSTLLSAGSSNRTVVLNSDLSALSLRATEYLQRWKEVVQFSSKDYSDQMRAQFGIKASEYIGNHAHYIGGWSNVININEVLNTNLDSENSQAVIA